MIEKSKYIKDLNRVLPWNAFEYQSRKPKIWDYSLKASLLSPKYKKKPLKFPIPVSLKRVTFAWHWRNVIALNKTPENTNLIYLNMSTTQYESNPQTNEQTLTIKCTDFVIFASSSLTLIPL